MDIFKKYVIIIVTFYKFLNLIVTDFEKLFNENRELIFG
jgi:hypothetical protein